MISFFFTFFAGRVIYGPFFSLLLHVGILFYDRFDLQAQMLAKYKGYFALVRKGNSKDEVFKTEVKMISSMMQKDMSGLTDKGSRFQR